jgi:hypothetical protein
VRCIEPWVADSGAWIVQDLAMFAWRLNVIIPSYGPRWVWGVRMCAGGRAWCQKPTLIGWVESLACCGHK